MRLAFDARCLDRPHSSYARTLELWLASAREVALETELWRGGPCRAEVLWSPNAELAPVRGPRLVATVHDVNPLLDDGRPLFLRLRREVVFRRRVRRLLRDAWRLATDSLDASQRIREAFGAVAAKVQVVPLHAAAAMQPGSADPAVLAGLGLETGYLLFVGALRRHKNWERLLHAWALVPGSLRARHPLLLAGDAHRAGRKLDRLLDRLLLRDTVRVAGRIPEAALPDLYRGAALFVFPSLMEGFGLPPLEAMACGTPVAASDRTSIPEVLGEAARFFDPTDIAAMARCLEGLLADSAARDDLRGRGLAQARKFTPFRTGQALITLLQS
ncbi:MAG TPA: glycosyltransferase family 1 protein [Planctomycetota bacterium]